MRVHRQHLLQPNTLHLPSDWHFFPSIRGAESHALRQAAVGPQRSTIYIAGATANWSYALVRPTVGVVSVKLLLWQVGEGGYGGSIRCAVRAVTCGEYTGVLACLGWSVH